MPCRLATRWPANTPASKHACLWPPFPRPARGRQSRFSIRTSGQRDSLRRAQTTMQHPAPLAHALLKRQELAYPVRFAQRPQTLEDRQGARQIGTRLRYVSLLLMEPAVAGVGERQFVLGPDLLQHSNAALEMECSQWCLALGRVGLHGDLP